MEWVLRKSFNTQSLKLRKERTGNVIGIGDLYLYIERCTWGDGMAMLKSSGMGDVVSMP